MKKIGLLALLLILPMLFACGDVEEEKTDEPMKNDFKMTAVVTAPGEKIEVDVVESEYASGPFWILTSESTSFVNELGEKIDKSDLSVGDTVIITYNGQVMMSYPPQIVAKRIVILE
jgi:hypothetical protein